MNPGHMVMIPKLKIGVYNGFSFCLRIYKQGRHKKEGTDILSIYTCNLNRNINMWEKKGEYLSKLYPFVRVSQKQLIELNINIKVC